MPNNNPLRMSQNVIFTNGQHVFRYFPPEYTEDGVPVLAKNPSNTGNGENEKEDKFQFIGEGYYFWDDNIERAHRWGNGHYKGDYLILELPLVLQGENFLDLVGSRKDLKLFLEVYSEMRKLMPGLKIGSFFYGMQTLAKYQPSKWPYTVIRVLNVKRNADRVSFNQVKGSEMLLNPEIIICFYEKNELNLQSKRYIDKNGKEWTPKK